MSGHVVSVNVGRPKALWTGSRIVDSAIGKQPVSGPVAARGVNLEGDDQADRKNHGGVEQAVYAYASEDTAWWGELIGRPLGAATFGENLTLEGVEVDSATVGERWAIGTTVLEVTCPRIPCLKLAKRDGDRSIGTRHEQAPV